jgi:hypothetical protein
VNVSWTMFDLRSFLCRETSIPYFKSSVYRITA